MLPTETDMEALSHRCNEFERRIAALENSESLHVEHDKEKGALDLLKMTHDILCSGGTIDDECVIAAKIKDFILWGKQS